MRDVAKSLYVSDAASGSRRLRLPVLLLWALVAGVAVLAGVESAEFHSTSPRQDATFKVNSGFVLLNVVVKDSEQVPVPGLTKENFTILEDGTPQEIVYFEEQGTPLAVVLVMDVSSSMTGHLLKEAKRAALEFVDLSHPDTEIALVAFNHKTEVRQDFTGDREALKTAIQQLDASGGTSLFDALLQSMEVTKTARFRRQALVVLSDGKDQDSSARFSQLENEVRSSPILFYAVGEYSEPERELFLKKDRYIRQPHFEQNLNPAWILQEFADLSGGAAFFPEPSQPVASFFNTIAREIEHSYVLGYPPGAPSQDPAFRKIEVRVSTDGKSPQTVKTRRGYLR